MIVNLDDYTKELETKAEEARRKAAEFDDSARARFGKGFYIVGAFVVLVVAGMLVKCVA